MVSTLQEKFHEEIQCVNIRREKYAEATKTAIDNMQSEIDTQMQTPDNALASLYEVQLTMENNVRMMMKKWE